MDISPDSLPFCNGDFGFGPVQNLLKLGNAMTHARMHVGLRALDVIVQIITEKLDVRNGGRGHIRVGELPGEQYKRHITDVFGRLESWHTTKLQGRIAIGV